MIETLAVALSRSTPRETPLTAELVLGRGSPVRGAVEALEGRLRSKGLSWDGLAPYLQLCSELFEIDTLEGPGHDDYAPSADGQRFLVKRPVEQGSRQQIHIVTDWLSLLE